MSRVFVHTELLWSGKFLPLRAQLEIVNAVNKCIPQTGQKQKNNRTCYLVRFLLWKRYQVTLFIATCLQREYKGKVVLDAVG